MGRDLKHNMCKLSANEWCQDRAQLPNHIEHCVLPELAYTGTHWASHLNVGVQNEAEPDAEVTSKRLSTWLEALSIIRSMDTAYGGSLDIARKIMQVGYSATTNMSVEIGLNVWQTRELKRIWQRTTRVWEG